MTSLRFDCPACGVTLTVPAAAAGVQGPCPKCLGEIVSPDPARGLPARLAPLPPPATAVTAAPPEPAVPPELPPAEQAPAVVPPSAAASRGIPWLGPVLLSAVVFSATGFLAGSWMSRHRSPAPVPAPSGGAPQPAPPPPVQESPPPAPAPAAPEPAPPSQAPPPEQEKPGAEAVLKSFLGAADWVARSEFVLFPEDTRLAMQLYAATHGDGPIRFSSLQLDQVDGPVHIFNLRTPALPEGFPVAVVDTPDGPKVNWENFINFHDDLFRKFAEGPAGSTGEFHVKIRPEPLQEGEAERLHARFRLSVPMPGREYLAYMRKDSVAMAVLRKNLDGSGEWNKEQVDLVIEEMGGIPVILKLAKRTTNDNRSYLEIEDLVAVTWSPAAKK